MDLRTAAVGIGIFCLLIALVDMTPGSPFRLKDLEVDNPNIASHADIWTLMIKGEIEGKS